MINWFNFFIIFNLCMYLIILCVNPIYSVIFFIFIVCDIVYICLILKNSFIAFIIFIIYISTISVLFLFSIMIYNFKKFNGYNLYSSFFISLSGVFLDFNYFNDSNFFYKDLIENVNLSTLHDISCLYTNYITIILFLILMLVFSIICINTIIYEICFLRSHQRWN